MVCCGVIIKYSVDDMRGGGGRRRAMCVCQLGLREGARSTIRRWGHFSVAHQSAHRQELRLHFAAQSQLGTELTDNLRILAATGRMTVCDFRPVMTNKQ